MLTKIKSLLRSRYFPLNSIEISRAALTNNYQYLNNLMPECQVAPVLKSNAYGHGLAEVARVLDYQAAPFFCVDSLYEAYELLKIKVKTPILITGFVDPRNLLVKKLPFSYAIFDIALAKALNQYQAGARVHIFIDTGMSREGITLDDLPEFLAELNKLANLKVVGIMSHFASADEVKNPQTNKQVIAFEKAIEMVEQAGYKLEWKHISASTGLLRQMPYFCNVARVGLALYGLSPMPQADPSLKPVLSFNTQLVQVKKVAKDSLVGYGGTHQLKKTTTIGILPVGYNDGVDRRLSDCGIVRIDGVECPIIGRVSMNITTIDVSKVKNPQIGQVVEIFSADPTAKNSLVNAAKCAKTIEYDLLVQLHPSIHRSLVD